MRYQKIDRTAPRSGLPAVAALLLLIGSAAAGAEATAPDGLDERSPVAVPAPSALAMSYYRTGNRLWALDEIWNLAVPALILFTGASAAIRNLARRMARGLIHPVLRAIGSPKGRSDVDDLADWPDRPAVDALKPEGALTWFFTIGIYAVLYTGLVFLIDLPLAYYQGFVRQHAYGLSNQTLGRWFGNALKGLLVAMVGGFVFSWVPYLLLARSPRRWWLYTTLLAVPFLFFVMLISPLWIDPLFNKYGPMKDQALEIKIQALAARAKIDGGRIFEVNKSVDTKAVNAYVKGFLGSKRIVLYDTLLAKLDDKEVLAVMAHEMGHYVLGHVSRTIWLSTIVILAGLFAVDRLGRRLIARFPGRFGFDKLSDVASVPLLLMLMQVTSLVLGPVALAYSRAQEHEADRFALELTRTNRSAALAFVKLQHENLSNPWPGPFYKIWRSSHPSIGERILFCNRYHPWTEGHPLVYQRWFRP